MEYLTAKNIVGILVVITGILDAIKYWIQANKIKRLRSAKGMSRRFINFAILSDLTKIAYSFLIRDIYIFSISALACVCMFYMFYEIYLYYPYRNRKRDYFKRPSLIIYTINSLLPNKLRKHL